jgi:hypothetical protein
MSCVLRQSSQKKVSPESPCFGFDFGVLVALIPLSSTWYLATCLDHSLNVAECSLNVAECSLNDAECSLIDAKCSLNDAECSLNVAECSLNLMLPDRCST